MHPILGQGSRLLLYLLTWLPVGVLLAAVLRQSAGAHWGMCFALALPLAFFYAFLCLAAWYPSRSLPLRGSALWQVVTSHGLGALLSSSLWQLVGLGWASALGRMSLFAAADSVFKEQALQLFAFGLLLYLLAAGGSYLFLAIESSYTAERQALESEQQRKLAAREMELARQLQARLLPPAELVEETFHLAARNLPASFVAGDFYDYFRLPDGSWRLAVADVAGKGMAASLITATVKAILPLIAADRSVVEAMGELNRRLEAQLDRREFVALLLAAWDPQGRRLELVNAGLPDPYLLHASKDDAKSISTAIEAPNPRLPLGIRAQLEYQSVRVDLAEDDRVLFFTDGLPEAPDASGAPIGYEVLESLLDHPKAPPGPWLDQLLERVRGAASSELEDDWTALLLIVS